MSTPTLQVIIASTRPGRVGTKVAEYVLERIGARDDFEVEVLDLAEIDLPLLDEPNHPRLRRYTKDHTKRWSATISRGDAFLIVMPEYNYSYNAALKNALDYLHVEWRGKPVALCSYGGISGGLRAAVAITVPLTALGMRVSQAAVSIPFVASHIEDGRFVGYDLVDQAIDAAYQALVRMHSERRLD